jgi:hypothetical protein
VNRRARIGPGAFAPISHEALRRLARAGVLCGLSLAPALAHAQASAGSQPSERTPAPASSATVTPESPADEASKLTLKSDPVDDYDFSPGESEEFLPSMEKEIETLRRGMFELGFIESPIRSYVDWADKLKLDTGLRIHLAYTTVFQQASGGPGDRTRFSGDLDIMSSWTLVGHGTKDRGMLVTTGEYRHQIGWENPNGLRDDIGSLQRTTGGFDDRGFVLRDLFYIQHLFDDRLRLLAGRSDVSDLVGGHRLQGINGSFSNRAFSADSTTAYPGGHVTSASASIRPVDWFYVTGGAANGYGRSSINDMQFLDEGKFFFFGEVGFTPTIEGMGPGRYGVLLWHMDERELINSPSDDGFTIILEQDLNERLHVFARYGNADNGVITGIERSTQAGLGYRGLLGSPDNLTGAAFAYSEPAGTGRDEKVVEVFHRFQVSAHVQFSAGVQGIFDPTNAPDDDALAVLTFRMRVAF